MKRLCINAVGGGMRFFLRLVQCRGSVFPKSFGIALPCGIIAAVFRYTIDMGYISVPDDSIIRETAAYTTFSSLAGFLVVFRTSQAYGRFWSGCTATHRMRAEWFDSCSQAVAFCKLAKASGDTVSSFQGRLVRLFSMLHAAALAELEEINHDIDSLEEIQAFHYKLIDPDGFDADTIRYLKHSSSKVELIFNWIQLLIIDNINNGVLTVAPPILSRTFQVLSNGMVAFFDALKITYSPMPFPYEQTCDLLLVIHWIMAPLVISQWVSNSGFAALFVTIQVFILWSLNFIACEIENPFGKDANDLDGQSMQEEMNSHLLLLLGEPARTLPQLRDSALRLQNADTVDAACTASFLDVWGGLEGTDDIVAVPIRTIIAASRDSNTSAASAPTSLASRRSRRSVSKASADTSLSGSCNDHHDRRSVRKSADLDRSCELAASATADEDAARAAGGGRKPHLVKEHTPEKQALAPLGKDAGSQPEASDVTSRREQIDRSDGDEASAVCPWRHKAGRSSTLSRGHGISQLMMSGGGPVDSAQVQPHPPPVGPQPEAPSTWRQDARVPEGCDEPTSARPPSREGS
mmetsp:Transcript_16159/g.48730  ORF Transcript_16159/g.48730 Transcript_16159/m.48730 type:complete len:578 (-) Transcript_16159:147-1880(-)